jgi:hypothetical protein
MFHLRGTQIAFRDCSDPAWGKREMDLLMEKCSRSSLDIEILQEENMRMMKAGSGAPVQIRRDLVRVGFEGTSWEG